MLTPTRRPWYRTAMHYVRRGHLYCGLFLLPWVLLYGVTAFLFNHPTAFADQPAVTFDRAALAGTPLESPPQPADIAAQVVAALQARAKPGVYCTLVEPQQAKFTREFAFATVRADNQEVSVLVEVAGTGGSVRSRAVEPPKPETRAPFAVGRGAPRPAQGKRPAPPKADDGLAIDNPLHDRVRAAVPAVLARTGFPAGDVTVTSVPDVSFLMESEGKVWRVTYAAMAGTVTGAPADEPADAPELSARRFLLRLHTAHGYPGEVNARWAWAVVVDAMAFVMVFWGVSGLFMWWQIKATRWPGAAVLVLSAASAVWVGFAMHDLMTR